MRVWFNGRTEAFQASDAGSIPVTRSTVKTQVSRMFRLACLHLSGIGTWRSLVARLLWEQDVAGSNPVVPTIGSQCGSGNQLGSHFLYASAIHARLSPLVDVTYH